MTERNETKQPLVLVINVGQQDVKNWISLPNTNESLQKIGYPSRRNDGDPKTAELQSIREKHQWLLAHESDWQMVSSIDYKSLIHTTSKGSDGARALAEKLGCPSPVFTANGSVALAAAKIDPILQAIKANSDKLRICGALVVYTERDQPDDGDHDDQKKWENEPIASGRCVAEFLREYTKLDKAHVESVNVTEGISGKTEGSVDEPLDIPLKRDIVHQIDLSILEFIESDPTGTVADAIPVLIATGGMQPFKQALTAAVALRFNATYRDLSLPELRTGKGQGEYTGQDLESVVGLRLCGDEPVISRHEAIEARARAVYLVRRGDFAGAWSTVAQFKGSATEAWWMGPLSAVAEYFGGQVSARRPSFTAKGPGQQLQQDLYERLDELSTDVEGLSKRYRRFALNAAMRLESACQGPDKTDARIADALICMASLIDTLVVAQGALLMEELAASIGFSGDAQSDYFTVDPVKAQAHQLPLEKRRKKFILSHIAKKWHENYPDRFSAIFELDSAFSSAKGKTARDTSPNLRSLRNDAAHRALNRRQIALIAEIGLDKRLWQFGARGMGQHALARTGDCSGLSGIVDAALRSVGIENAQAQYANLVDGLLALLRQPEPGA